MNHSETTVVAESTPEELATQRYLFDLALQPLDRFDGFTHLEQIGGSALRYQLSYIGYALSMAQYTRTPAFTGYLAEAQANAIRKMCDKRVWGYWAIECAVGYGRWDPDPITFANVMYSGFFAAMISFYETMNHDRQFDADGSLPLVWNRRRRLDYGFDKLARAIEHNMRRSPHTLYACEPHLIYPMCNAIAITGLRGYDRLHGTDLGGDLVDDIRESFSRNEYLLPNGRFRFGLGPLGLKFPPTVSNDAVMVTWLHGVMPDLAEQAWTVLRDKRIEIDNGVARLRTSRAENIDAGSYRRGDVWAWVNVACAAREMGDAEISVAVDAAVADRFRFEHSQDGARKLAGVSTWANTVFALAQSIRASSMSGLANGNLPDAWRSGPILTAAPYPDVLVAKAVTDGNALELVLRPGRTGADTTLELGRLKPGLAYKVTGARVDEIKADSLGRALVEIRLWDRLEVRVMPT